MIACGSLITQGPSSGLKPDPVTVTDEPAVPESGESVMVAVVTVNGTEIDPCTTAPPEIVTVCGPKAAVK